MRIAHRADWGKLIGGIFILTLGFDLSKIELQVSINPKEKASVLVITASKEEFRYTPEALMPASEMARATSPNSPSAHALLGNDFGATAVRLLA